MFCLPVRNISKVTVQAMAYVPFRWAVLLDVGDRSGSISVGIAKAIVLATHAADTREWTYNVLMRSSACAEGGTWSSLESAGAHCVPQMGDPEPRGGEVRWVVANSCFIALAAPVSSLALLGLGNKNEHFAP